MQGERFTISYHTAGALAANHVFCFSLPCDAQLIQVSAVGGNANDGLLIIGNSDNDDAYLESASIGDSYTPVVFSKANFVGTEYPHIPAGTIVKATLDYDGAGGTATQNFTLLLTFLEG
jgi:hypothetical protein